MRILLIDDSRLITSFVKSIADSAGYELTTAENGLLGIEVIKNNPPFDLIFLDWNMPVMMGPEFLQKNFDEKITTTPIVMLTTENKPEYIQKAISLGITDYVMKPFTEEIFISKVQMIQEQKAG